ncbi:MAG: hypothetical protein JWO38_6340, partial [Gemmataceae bacterium]|nr:hypothetical protein [Gemmataceae bacterium]
GATAAEPPRAMPARPLTPPPAPGRTDPVMPPTPVIPGPPPGPLPVPPPGAGSIPIPTPMPPPGSVPLPVPMPAAPPGVPVPTIPIPAPPGGAPQARAHVVPAVSMRSGGPIEVVLPVGYVPPEFATAQDIRPFAVALREALAPSVRITAAKGLAGGRHGSTDLVKRILFQAAQTDPCPEVRACCIEHLCTLGYYDPAFLKHLRLACADPSEEVRAAAKTAVVKMTPRR